MEAERGGTEGSRYHHSSLTGNRSPARLAARRSRGLRPPQPGVGRFATRGIRFSAARKLCYDSGPTNSRRSSSMKLDTGLSTRNLREVPAAAKAAEEAGFDALWSMEAGNDAFLPLALVAEHTRRIKLGPSVAIAFPRSPMAMAYTAWDLAALSHGRFILGLGTQVKGHIERRYGVKWEAPVAKLREYILALKAIFKCWAEGGRELAFQGKFYNFSLMTPFFAPRPHNYRIPIYIAGVNEHILRLAG